MTDLSSYIDVPNKTVHLVGEVNNDMYLMVQRAIGKLHKDPRPIVFTLNSDGGYLNDGLAIYDLIKGHCHEPKIIVYGACMSAAMVILQAGTERISTPNAEFMIHYGHEQNESGEEKKANDRLGNTMRDILHKNSNVKKATMTRWVNTIKHLDSSAALKYGLVDKVMGNE